MIDQIVLKIASRCNLNCTYCYLYNHEDASWKERDEFISDEVLQRALTVIKKHCDGPPTRRVAVLFHGGEPTLVGPERLVALARQVRSALGPSLVSLGIQTNGTRLGAEMIDAIVRSNIEIGVSLDGPAKVHDAARVNHGGRGSQREVVRGLQRLAEVNLQPGVLCVVNPFASGEEVYRYFRKLGLSRITFLLPDVSHDNKSRFYPTRSPTPVADYLIPIFDRWFTEDDPEVIVRPFTDLIAAMLGGRSSGDLFGNPLQTYVVIETDGSIETLDALRVCEDGITRTKLNVFVHTFDDIERVNPLLHRMIYLGLPPSKACLSCKEISVCGGGYLPHRYSRLREFDNPSVWCNDILKLFAHIRTVAGLEIR